MLLARTVAAAAAAVVSSATLRCAARQRTTLARALAHTHTRAHYSIIKNNTYIRGHSQQQVWLRLRLATVLAVRRTFSTANSTHNDKNNQMPDTKDNPNKAKYQAALNRIAGVIETDETPVDDESRIRMANANIAAPRPLPIPKHRMPKYRGVVEVGEEEVIANKLNDTQVRELFQLAQGDGSQWTVGKLASKLKVAPHILENILAHTRLPWVWSGDTGNDDTILNGSWEPEPGVRNVLLWTDGAVVRGVNDGDGKTDGSSRRGGDDANIDV
jgi:hypothetical protein